MAITVNTPATVSALPNTAIPFLVSGYTTNASFCEELKAAPGENKAIYIVKLVVSAATGTDPGVCVQIGQGENDTNCETILLNYVFSTDGANPIEHIFERPIKLADNKSLTVDCTGSGFVAVTVHGAIA